MAVVPTQMGLEHCQPKLGLGGDGSSANPDWDWEVLTQIRIGRRVAAVPTWIGITGTWQQCQPGLGLGGEWQFLLSLNLEIFSL